MDSVQEHTNCINITLLQTFRSYLICFYKEPPDQAEHITNETDEDLLNR
jgi:hypothetical protein